VNTSTTWLDALLEAIVLSDGGERHQRIVQLLVDHGANMNIPDKDGVTPLKHAQTRGFKEIERILLRAGGAEAGGAEAGDPAPKHEMPN